MAKLRSFNWMVSPKSMISLMGAEYILLRQSGSGVLRKFYISAILVVIIMATSACSIFYAVDLLVHNYFVELLLSIFISLLFGFMYIFLTNTFAKDPHAPKTSIATFSNITRIGFVIFMAFVLSKPIEIWLLESRLEEKVIEYRQSLLAKHSTVINEIYRDDIDKLEKDKIVQKQFAGQNSAPIFLHEIENLDNKIEKLNYKKSLALELINERIQGTSFFIYRVNEAAKSSIAWICCIFIIALFCLPGLLIYSISANNAYFKLKKDYETRLILKEYSSFEDKYAQIFKEVYNITRCYYSVFDDPPFNTKRKREEIKYRNQEDFFKRFLKNQQ